MNKIHHFRKNTKVFIKTKDGQSIVARYHQQKGKYMLFLDREEIRLNKIRFVSIYNPLFMRDPKGGCYAGKSH